MHRNVDKHVLNPILDVVIARKEGRESGTLGRNALVHLLPCQRDSTSIAVSCPPVHSYNIIMFGKV
jgi:hypothetical protein